MKEKWPKIIILVDMDAFFASIEQLDFPELQGKPVAVTNGNQGSCIITSSYEARAYGIKTGMRLQEAHKRCSHLIRQPSRPARYAEMSRSIMDALTNITPDIEIFSIDEAFLDLTHCQKIYSSPLKAAQKTKDIILEASGLSCSVGIGHNKTNAKFAAKLKKPNGLEFLKPEDAEKRLALEPVTKLCGISHGIASFLKQYGITQCGQVKHIPINVLAKRFGNLGRRLWYMCQGEDPDPVHVTIPQPKTMGHGKILPPNTASRSAVCDYCHYLCERLAARLRQHNMTADLFFFGIKTKNWGWVGHKCKFNLGVNCGLVLLTEYKRFFASIHEYGVIYQLQITALNPKSSQQQLDLFCKENQKQFYINQVRDDINRKFGAWSISPSSLNRCPEISEVIAPAWRPKGPRNSVDH